MAHSHDPTALAPELALARLVEGNQRFRDGITALDTRGWNRQASTNPQRPFAVVLGCSDSRTPVELLFDQGFGDLFVVRVAGNIVAPSIVGSIEFAVSQFGTRLVVVMGHTGCGAVTASLEVLRTGQNSNSKHIRAITDRITPHIAGLVAHEYGALANAGGAGTGATRPGATATQSPPAMPSTPSSTLVREAVLQNVRASSEFLRRGSAVLEELVESGHVAIVSAEYELETGAVNFFDRSQVD